MRRVALLIGFYWRRFRVYGMKGVRTFLLCRKRSFFIRRFFIRSAQRFVAQTPERGLTLVGNLTCGFSISKTFRDLAHALKKAGIPFQALDMCQFLAGMSMVAIDDVKGLLTPREEFNVNRYSHIVTLSENPIPRAAIGNKKVSRLIFWEADSGLQEANPDWFRGDDIVGMSDFNVDYFRTVMPKGVKVSKMLYPFRFDCGRLDDAAAVRARYGIGRDEFVVFFNFDFCTSVYRKNPFDVVRAFAKAFSQNDRVRLFFKTNRAQYNPEGAKQLADLIHDLGIDDQVSSANEYLSQRELYSLTNACDVYISLHRAEGFGLGIAEAMSMGKPVIVTGWSANTEFCKPDNSILIPYELKRPAGGSRGDSLNNNSVTRWAEPDVDAAAVALRRLYQDREERLRVGERARTFMREHFSSENFKRSIVDFLST